MVTLKPEDKNNFVNLVKGKGYLFDELKSIFQKSDLQKTVSKVKFDGEPETVLYNIITFLEQYGQISLDHEALGLFLKTMYDSVGYQEQVYVVEFLKKYDLLPPSEIPQIKIPDKVDQISNVANTGLKTQSTAHMSQIVNFEPKSFSSSVQPNVSRGSSPNEHGNKDPSYAVCISFVMTQYYNSIISMIFQL